jgi:hypothetical protein
LIAYGLSATLEGGGRQLRTTLANLKDWAQAFSWNLSSDRRRVILYSVQTLKRRRPEWYRADLIVLFDLLQRGLIKPLIAARLTLDEVRLAHELLAAGSTVGKLVLINDYGAGSDASTTRSTCAGLARCAAGCPCFWPGFLGLALGAPFENGVACRLPALNTASSWALRSCTTASRSVSRCFYSAFSARNRLFSASKSSSVMASV